MTFKVNINGIDHTVDVDGDTPLLWVLRDALGMTGTKFGCGMALCGACTVHQDGNAIRSCSTTIDSVGESAITTIEAIDKTPAGQKIQKAWLDLEVVQCGYCQPGQIMSATALLASKAHPTDSDIDDAMSGNICRCHAAPAYRSSPSSQQCTSVRSVLRRALRRGADAAMAGVARRDAPYADEADGPPDLRPRRRRPRSGTGGDAP
jgi:isoquinoline 1-oxidoreductase subunit alpha